MPDDLFFFERQARAQGANLVCGIDEVGRGPLIGPVVASAVILPNDFQHSTLTDSKQLTQKKREEIYKELTENKAVKWSIASIEAEEIDRINILQATWKAMVQARANLKLVPDWTLVDGPRVPPLGNAQTSIIKGDQRSFSIAAASVIAKVTRDRWMNELDQQYPGYGFAQHKGYGTQLHLEALKKLGPCPVHRYSFKPVQLAIQQKEER